MSRELVLASGSRYRRELLEQLGVPFDVSSPDVDESRLHREAPDAMAARLARAKARAVAEDRPDAWVIGSDQVIALEQRVFGKPGTAEAAVDQLLTLQGRTHRLVTAVCIVSPAGMAESLVAFEMKMRSASRQTLAQYVAEDDPIDCAGSYRIESRGIRLFEYMRGDDYTAIVGLPLTTVVTLLHQTEFFEEAP